MNNTQGLLRKDIEVVVSKGEKNVMNDWDFLYFDIY